MPTDWNDLIDDVKEHIIKLLDYESRCNLRICSKSDKIHVDSVKFMASKFEVREIYSEESPGKSHIRLDIDGFTVWFIGKNRFTKVYRDWNGKLQSDLEEIKKECRHDVAKRYIDKFMVKNSVLAANRIEMSYIKLTPLKSWRIQCEEMEFVDSPSAVRWLRQSSPKLRKMHILYLMIERHIGWETLSQITNTSESFRVRNYEDTKMSDELLAAINTPDLEVKSSNFTVQGMKMALDRFLRIGKQRDTLTITGEFHESKNAVLKALVKNLKLERKSIETFGHTVQRAFDAKIIGGFDNIHGLQDARELNIVFSPLSFSIDCKIWEKPEKKPCILTPFTDLDRKHIGRITFT